MVRTRRAKGVGWREIARDVSERTGVNISHETLRQWYPEDSQL